MLPEVKDNLNNLQEYDLVQTIYENGLAEQVINTWATNQSYDKTAELFGISSDVIKKFVKALHSEYPKILLQTYPGLMDKKIDKNIDLFGNLLGMVGEMKDVLDKSKSNGEIINEKYYFKAFSELKDLLKFLVDKKTELQKIFERRLENLQQFKQIVLDEVEKLAPETQKEILENLKKYKNFM